MVSSPYETELLIAALRYLVVCLDGDHQDTLLEMGLSEAEISSVPLLSLEDLQILTRSPRLAKSIIEVKFKPTGLSRMIEHAEREREYRRTKFELMMSDAPQPMMHQFYHMGFNEYAGLRKRHGITGGLGRPSYTEEDEKRVWNVFDKLKKTKAELTAGDYIILYKESGVSLRIIWRMVENWESEGLLLSKAVK